MQHKPSIVGFVPARGGSKRVPRKNIRPLAGHPLLAYSICSALDSGIFTNVCVSSDSVDILNVAQRYGARGIRRPDEYGTDTSPDIEWILHALKQLPAMPDAFAILRPTSPFRKPETIRRAWSTFLLEQPCDSLRAIERVHEHPGKMWIPDLHVEGKAIMIPLLPQPVDHPWHSSQYPTLPTVHVQNASLEIAWTKTVLDPNDGPETAQAGSRVTPFFTVGDEGVDINDEFSFAVAEEMVKSGKATLPEVRLAAE